MDFQLYQSILKFHCRGTFPQDFNFNRQKKHHFKQLCSRYNKPKLTLFNKKRPDSKYCIRGMQILLSKNYIGTTSILKQLNSSGLLNNPTMSKESGLLFGK